MVGRFRDRITILEDQEIDELYGRPQFNHDERLHFFSLCPEERALADAHHNLANSVLFVLQLGYFKARTMFFAFEFEDVREDARHILHQYYSRAGAAELSAPTLKRTRHTQQRKILDLYGYRVCGGNERAAMMGKAAQVVGISAKPVFLFHRSTAYSALWARSVRPSFIFATCASAR